MQSAFSLKNGGFWSNCPCLCFISPVFLLNLNITAFNEKGLVIKVVVIASINV